jgi:putative Mg2+ transporter-C (MgtC) family protein
MNLGEILSITPFSWSALATCIGCGFIIGLERQLRGKPVGMRTSSLIVLGTYVFITLANFVTSDVGATQQVSDPSRIIGQVVTGVGFLGAGVMLARDGVVVGVTSAATIWVLAAIGVSIAITDHWISIKLALVAVSILWGIDILEDYSTSLTRGVHAKITDWRRNRR